MTIDLKERTEQHVRTFFEKTQREEIKRWIPLGVQSLEEALLLYEETKKEGANSFGKTIYVEKEYVGDIWVYGIDEKEEKMAMLSIVLFETGIWGKGIGSFAISYFCEEVFQIYGIHKIGACTYEYNLPSIFALQKAGFQVIERFEEEGVGSFYLEKCRG